MSRLTLPEVKEYRMMIDGWSTKNKTLLFVVTVIFFFTGLMAFSLYTDQKNEMVHLESMYSESLNKNVTAFLDGGERNKDEIRLFLNDSSRFFGPDGTLFVQENVGDKPHFRVVDDTLHMSEILETIRKEEYNFKVPKKMEIADRTFVVYPFDVRLVSDPRPHKLLFYHDTTHIDRSFEKKVRDMFVNAFLLLMLLILVIELGFRGLIQKIEDSNRELNEQQVFLNSIIDSSRDGIALLDLNSKFLFFNKTYLKMTGFSAEELIQKSCAELSAPEDIPRAMEALETVKKVGYIDNFEKTCIVKDGKRLKVNMAVTLMPDRQRQLLNARDITEAKKLENSLQAYVKTVDEYVITSQTDLSGTITYASEAFCRISGYSKEELIGKNHRIIRHPDMPTTLFDDLWSTIRSGRTWQGEIKNRKSDGSEYWVDTRISPIFEDDRIVGYSAVRYDITYQKMVERMAVTDPLCEIDNRRSYTQVIRAEMSRASRHGYSIALLMIDVDFFKRYNDTYGHQAGDEVLKTIGTILKASASRSGEYAFRLGGEEFAVVVSQMEESAYLTYAQKICEAVRESGIEHRVNEAAPVVTVSIGIAVYYPEDTFNEEELYRLADLALYEAKDSGRDRAVLLKRN